MPTAERPAGLTIRGAAGVLLQCRDEEVLLEGRAGGGKTIGAMRKLVDACCAYPGSRHLLCRQTRKSMTDSILVTLESVIGEAHPEVRRVSRENRQAYRLNGSEIVCAGLDEPAKAFGTAWGLVVLEEAIEASLDAWELFGRSARDPRLRRAGEKETFPYHQRMALTNPGPPNHWLNSRATKCDDAVRRVESWRDWERTHRFNSGPQDGRMRRLISVHQDNPAFFETGTWRWTPAGERYLRSLQMMTGHRRARMFEGRWVAAEGSVFGAEFELSRNVAKCFNVPSTWPVWFYLDPGYDHPCGAFWLTVGPTGKRWVIDEIYERQTAIPDLVAIIRRREAQRGYKPLRRYLDPRYGFSRTAFANGTTIQEQFLEEDLHFEPWPRLQTESQDAAVNAVRKGFTSGQLVFFDRCVNAIGETQTWSYKRNAAGEQLAGDDQYEDKNNHLLDPLIASAVTAHRFEDATAPSVPPVEFVEEEEEPRAAGLQSWRT